MVGFPLQSQQGHALTEFTVVAVVLLIPLFLLIPVLAKLISQSHDMNIAARYVAWERTIWYSSDQQAPFGNDSAADNVVKTDGQLAYEVDARIFANSDEPIRTSVNTHYELDAFLHHHDGEAFLQGFNGDEVQRYARLATQETEPNEDTHVYKQNREAEKLEKATDERFDVNMDGKFTGTVSVSLIDLTDIFDLDGVDMSNFELTRSNTIFAEAWEAGGTRHGKRMIGALTPQDFANENTSAIENAQSLVSEMRIGEELHEDCLVFGYASIEPVPPHRLSRPDSRITSVRGVGDDTGCDLEHPDFQTSDPDFF